MVTTIVDCQAYQPRACIHPDIIRQIIGSHSQVLNVYFISRSDHWITPGHSRDRGCLAWFCGLQEGRELRVEQYLGQKLNHLLKMISPSDQMLPAHPCISEWVSLFFLISINIISYLLFPFEA